MKLYTHFLRDKYFNKIILTFCVIITLSLVALAFLANQIYSISFQAEALSYNKQVVQAVDQYINGKNEKVKLMLQQPYYFPNLYNGYFDYLATDAVIYSVEHLIQKNIELDFINSFFMFDPDIKEILILKRLDSTMTYKSLFDQSSKEAGLPDNKKLLKAVPLTFNGTVVFPSSNIYNKKENESSIYSIASNIWNSDFSNSLGILLVNFNKKELQYSYSSNKNFESNVLVFTTKGDLLFNSSSEYSVETYKYLNNLSLSTETHTTRNDIVNLYRDDKLGIMIASILPKSQINTLSSEKRSTIIILMILCILAAIILSYISVASFMRRIKVVHTTMKEIRTGNIDVRIPISPSKDEINDIAYDINQMCDNLKTHIDRVFVLGIKQNAAELSALQSQVNPHFLYNTLEAIRMKAVTSGNEEVARMIRILGTLFRNSIKQKMIIHLREELNYCNLYLDLFKLRYEQNLKITIDISKEILDYGTVKHLLQPLIENSLVHGIDSDKEQHIISIKGLRVENDIIITIEDNGLGIAPEKLKSINEFIKSPQSCNNDSLGIVNVNHRIKLIYGEEYGLTLTSIEGTGTCVEVKIPLKTVEELEQNVQSTVG